MRSVGHGRAKAFATRTWSGKVTMRKLLGSTLVCAALRLRIHRPTVIVSLWQTAT